MSTISDALKKVQRQRLAAPGAPPAERAPRAAHPVALLVIVTTLAAAAIFYARREAPTQPDTKPRAMRPAETPAAPPQSVSPPAAPGLTRGAQPASVPAPEVPSSGREAPPVAPPPAATPSLAGIVYSAHRPVAIINGSALQEGDTVGAYRVIRIAPTAVVLGSPAGEIELRLK